MPTIRTTNRRAKSAPGKHARRIRRLRKALRLGIMYGMGTRKFSESMKAQYGGTVTGRAVSTGPNFEYQFPKRAPVNTDPDLLQQIRYLEPVVEISLLNYAGQERRALLWHREALDKARERGDTVVEHSNSDATIFVKGD